MNSGIIIIALVTAIISGKSSDSKSLFSYQSDFQLSGGKEFFVQGKAKYKYVGARACVDRCHNSEESGFQYNKWKKSRHSKSYISLSSVKALKYAQKAGIKENPQESLICLKCHITGSGLDSSSFGSTYSKEEGVTCEACHKDEFTTITLWKGNSRVVNTKDLQPDEKTCLKCHNNQVHKTGRFNFKTMFEKIAHMRRVG